ncbi:2',5'-phosphodiesterase 12-like [Paramacrobiotus metropolitanus]|uniref:2',5'-phosphodiesterase 12-like n=1 Tax=Paramacrobiotus metropolitanus TaxID=2943436 RepID=UPI002445DAA9|nr:2',5'-phosphodiesterase 12-like [Paramacrobiotus metropolitanus]
MRICRSVLSASPCLHTFLARPLSTPSVAVKRMAAASPPSLADQLRQERLFVYHTPEDTHMLLRLRFRGTPAMGTLRRDRLFNFRRPKDEEVGRTLERMAQNLTSKITTRIKNKKAKKAKLDVAVVQEAPAEESESLAVSLRRSGKEIPSETLNGSTWTEGDQLLVDSAEFTICVNPPVIPTGKITKHILPNFPVDVTLDCDGVIEEQSIFVWLKQKTGKRSVDPIPFDFILSNDGQKIPSDLIAEALDDVLPHPGRDGWEVASVDKEWTPGKEHVGLLLSLLCLPIKDDVVGEPIALIAKNPIAEPLTEPIPFMRRHESCQQRAGSDGFRIVSYNLLADLYADQEASLKELFPYCPPECIKGDYRRQLTLRELIGYNADIICVQELDTKLFNSYYSKQMRRKGYEGLFLQKTGKAHEGIGTFYRTDKFRLLNQYDINITSELFENPANKDLADAVNSKAKLKEVMMTRTNPLQVCYLQDLDGSGRSVLVANTHLWFRPQYPRVRLLQMGVSLRHLQRIVKDVTAKDSTTPAIILCGDFNSSTGWGVHHLLNKRSVPVDFPEWKMFCTEDDEYVELALEHPFHLFNACGELQYTNYTAGFKAAIDWIYADAQQLDSRFVIPMPTEDELSAFTAIPSPVFPSDHIAIGCDLHWKA